MSGARKAFLRPGPENGYRNDEKSGRFCEIGGCIQEHRVTKGRIPGKEYSHTAQGKSTNPPLVRERTLEDGCPPQKGSLSVICTTKGPR
ncbi:hypothetical protein Tco_0131285 [Tanacetum coccineum]